MEFDGPEAFVRALRSPYDPPAPELPSKIEIADAAWRSNSIYVPSKDRIIVEWLLSTLLNAKDDPACVIYTGNISKDLSNQSFPVGDMPSSTFGTGSYFRILLRQHKMVTSPCRLTRQNGGTRF